MYTVYILYSVKARKSYTGYTADLERRLIEHNETATSGFTIRYRPWLLIHIELFSSKKEAMAKEKFYKSGVGRIILKQLITDYLKRNNIEA